MKPFQSPRVLLQDAIFQTSAKLTHARGRMEGESLVITHGREDFQARISPVLSGFHVEVYLTVLEDPIFLLVDHSFTYEETASFQFFVEAYRERRNRLREVERALRGAHEEFLSL